jgi:hypothetical protein
VRDKVLVKSREMTGRTQITAVVAGRRRGKDDRKQNTLTPLDYALGYPTVYSVG